MTSHFLFCYNRHWDEFYTAFDIYEFSAVGISHLRIPYGYWMFSVTPGEPFPTPSYNDNEGIRFYLKRLVQWADTFDIKVKFLNSWEYDGHGVLNTHTAPSP